MKALLSNQHRYHSSQRPNTSDRVPQGGFVLLTVLMLLALATIILSRLATYSFALASRAKTRSTQLQQRWATYSLSHVTVKQAPTILQQTNRANSAEKVIQLNGQNYRLFINDLDTAINVNAVYRHTGLPAAQRATQYAERKSKTRLKALTETPISSWSQLASTSLSARQVAILQQSLTCWGSGKLNIRKVSTDQIQELGSITGQPAPFGRLADILDDTPGTDLQQAIADSASTDKDRQLLNQLLGQTSTTWSVIVVDPNNNATQTILETGGTNFADKITVFRY